MSAAGEALVAAVRGLVPDQWDHYHGEVAAKDPAPPWVVSSVGIPDDAHRSEGAWVSAGDLDVYLTTAGSSEAQARIVLQAVADAFAGAVVSVPGWSVGAFVQYQRPRVYPTDVEIGGVARHLFTGVVGYRATCSRSLEG